METKLTLNLSDRIEICDLHKHLSENVVIAGWVQIFRMQKTILFFDMFDNEKSMINPLSVVVDIKANKEYYENLTKMTCGTSLIISGKIVETPTRKQSYELQGDKYEIYGLTDILNFPSVRKNFDFENIRMMPQLECYHPTKAIIYSVRSELMKLTEEFYYENNFKKVEMPLITFSECEGGCQPMQTTLCLTTGLIKNIPLLETDKTKIDFSKEFFGAKSCLTVSSQLELETQIPLGNVWTLTRAVRGEPSQTSKHLSEFSMIEIEMPFIKSAETIMQMTEKHIKYCLANILIRCKDELMYLEKKLNKNITEKIKKYIDCCFVRTTHRKVVDLIKEEKTIIFKSIPEYDEDLSTEHEKFIVEKYGCPVFVMRYPKKIKSFYMPVIEAIDGIEYVDCFDLLVPDVGELVGGSQRIHKIEELESRIKELGLDRKPLEFYIDLRKNGTNPHGGMGMGFERLVKFVLGIDNIKDCVAFPKFIGCAK